MSENNYSLTFPNRQSFEDYFSKINNFKTNEIIFLADEKRFAMFDGEQFIDIPDKVQVTGEGLSMSLYELNKTIVSQLPIKETYAELSQERNLINEFHENIKSETYMLLCKDISYYTIFNNRKNKVNDFGTLGHAVVECAQDVGKIISADVTEDNSAIEIWVRTAENDNLCMYLFDCKNLTVTFGG